MRKTLYILFAFGYSLLSYAESFTVSIDAWNKASLSGDVTNAMTAKFVSSTKSAGKVTKDNTAELTISGLPACTVNAIKLYVRSNQSSGAGMIMISLGDELWLVANGDFNHWPGISDYSTSPQIVSALNYAIDVDKAAQLIVRINGTVNSIYLDQMVVDYTPNPPVAHTLTLQWLSSDGTIHSKYLTESAPEEGIILPAIDSKDTLLTHNSEKWFWIGWCKPQLNTQYSSPVYWETNDWFYLEDDCTLYGLFTNSSSQTLQQDTSYLSGEYAIVFAADEISTQYALAGPWNSGRITLQNVPLVQNASHDWTWTLNNLDSNLRYQLEFTKDSVSIYHPSSQTWLGHTTSSASKLYSQWAWKKTIGGGAIFYNTMTTISPNLFEASCLSVNYNAYSQQIEGTYQTDVFDSSVSYWHLFPTGSIPTQSTQLYTTFADVSAEPVVQTNISPTSKKWLDSQHSIVIQYNNQYFNLLGQPL